MVKKSLFLFIACALAVSGCLGGDGLTDESEPRLTADSATGDAPLNVTFTLEGGGDDSEWTLDLGDGDLQQGTGLPSTYTHTFTEAGNYTVTLSIDGTEATAELVVMVNGSTGAVQEHSGGWTLTTPANCALIGEGLPPLNGVFTQGIDLDTDTIGQEFTANFTSAVEDAVVEYLVQFMDTDNGFELAESFSGAPGSPVTGEIPEDADRVYFSACGVTGPVEVDYRTG